MSPNIIKNHFVALVELVIFVRDGARVGVLGGIRAGALGGMGGTIDAFFSISFLAVRWSKSANVGTADVIIDTVITKATNMHTTYTFVSVFMQQ